MASIPEIIDVQLETPRAHPVRRLFAHAWNSAVDTLVALILWLAAKRKARSERKALLRVISPFTRCRGCGWTGERGLFGSVKQLGVRIEFVEIQPTGQNPATGAIKLTCYRCNAWWHVPTVQPAHEWVQKKATIKNPMIRG